MKAKRLRQLHAVATLFWVAMIPPTIMWWKDSVAFLVFISIYTIIIDHVTAWQTAKFEDKR